MTPTLLEAPAIEPVALADMKAWLRITSSDEDDLLGKLITAARLTVEAASGCELIAQRWRVSLDRWPRDGVARLPLKPALSCEAVRVYSDATTAVTLAPSSYMLDARSAPPRLVMLAPAPAPGRVASGIEIDLTVGFGATVESVPQALRQAIRLLAARWFERRGDDAQERVESPLPPDVVALIAPFRDLRV